VVPREIPVGANAMHASGESVKPRADSCVADGGSDDNVGAGVVDGVARGFACGFSELNAFITKDSTIIPTNAA